MNIIDFFITEQKRLHKWMGESVRELTLAERAVTVKPLGGMMAVQAIGQACITHCFMHFGEIACMLGELGKQGMPM